MPLAHEDHTCVATREERIRYKGLWCITQHIPGTTMTATRHREDYFEAISKFRQAKNAAVTSGENMSPHIPPSQRVPQRSTSQLQQQLPTVSWCTSRGNLEHMCKHMSPGTAGGHHPLTIGGTGGKIGTRLF